MLTLNSMCVTPRWFRGLSGSRTAGLPILAAMVGVMFAGTDARAQTVVSSPSIASPVVMTQPTATTSAVCSKCGRVHGNQGTNVPMMTNTVSPVGHSAAITSSMSPSMPARSGGVQNVLSALNGQRSRQGLRALTYDPALQAVAQRRASMMASSGTKSHPPGSFAPGRYEGVGWDSSYSPSGVSACFTSNPNMRAAGAAMATGRDGVYFCVVYR